MMWRQRWLAVLTAATCCLFLAANTSAIAPEIRDDGKFFSPAVLKKADAQIRDIYRRHHRDVLVETFAAVPAGDVEKVKALDPGKRNLYMLQWAKDRSKERVVSGLYILLCKEPFQFVTGLDEPTPHKFAPGARAAIDKLLEQKWTKEARYDEGLEQLLRLIEDKLMKK